MSAVLTIDAGAPGSAADHMRYILRPSACEPQVLHQHLPPDVAEALAAGNGQRERYEKARRAYERETHRSKPRAEVSPGERGLLIAWADQVDRRERLRHGKRAGQPRTFYRVVLSYKESLSTTKVLDDAARWLSGAFPEARALGAVHKNTERPHIHLFLSARQVTGKKIHYHRREFEQLLRSWSAVYEARLDRRMRRGFAPIRGTPLSKKLDETRALRQALRESYERGEGPEARQQLIAAHRKRRASPPPSQVYRERDVETLIVAVGRGLSKEAQEQLKDVPRDVRYAVKQLESSAEYMGRGFRRKDEIREVLSELSELSPEDRATLSKVLGPELASLTREVYRSEPVWSQALGRGFGPEM
ncbi:MAG: hypothetical protein GVY12_13175 [Bacteroidetes bacterium]|jgi:hypothetical protein|nr:hypothetical protein [Bacteroidota bacterium]